MRYLQLALTFAALLTVLSWSVPAAAPPSPTTALPYDFVYLGDSRPVLYRLQIVVDGKPLQAAWEDFIQHLFEYLDTDKDGVLTREDVVSVPAASLLFANNQFVGGFQPPSMADLDKNNDGKVTRDELGAYYRSSGAAPFQIQMGQAPSVTRVIAVAPDGRRVQNSGADALNERLFQLLDTDKDGKLSAAELAAAPTALLRRDLDDDEMVSSDELMARPVTSAYGAFVGGQAKGGGQPGSANFLAVVPGESLTALGRQLRDFYAPKGKALTGTNPTRATMKLDEAAFTLLDSDGNGELDAEELSRFAQRPADVELILRLGTTARGQAVVEAVRTPGGTPLSANLKTRANGASLDLGTTRLDLTTMAASSASVGLKVSNQQVYKMQFSQADKDNNGYLDSTEVQRTIFQALFKAMDRDHDGKLFEKEMFAYFDQMEALRTKAMAGCVTLNISDLGKGLFDLLDSSRDGRLSVRELRNAVKLLDSLDRDGDRCIALAEIPRNYQLVLRRGGAAAQTYATRLVVAGSAFGMGGARLPEPTAGPVWFRKMDRNRDGDVSRREFLGTEEEFTRLDTDGDGLISVDEAERARAPR